MVKVNTGDLQHKREGFRTRREAEDYERQVKEQMLIGVNPRAYILAQVAERWLNHRRQHGKESTYKDYEYILRVHILPALGGRKLDDITAMQVQDFLDSLTTGPKGKEQPAGN